MEERGLWASFDRKSCCRIRSRFARSSPLEGLRKAWFVEVDVKREWQERGRKGSSRSRGRKLEVLSIAKNFSAVGSRLGLGFASTWSLAIRECGSV